MANAELLLAGSGIPTFISSKNSGPALGFVLANKYTLWVCLENQYEDAVNLLKNPDHVVKNPVDVDDYHRFVESSSRESANRFYDHFMLIFVISLIAGFSVFVYFSVTST
jgi:hypothetical protein